MAKSKPPIRRLSKRPLRLRPLIYAHPGVGKSRLAGSSVEIGNTLILNADGPDGPESMRTAGYDPDIWDVKSVTDLQEAFDFLRRGGTKEYEWVWLDSVSLWEASDMDDIMDQLHKEKSHRDIHLPDKPQYMLRQNHLSRWVRQMHGLPINFGMTAHVMSIGIEDEDENESTAQYMPAIQGGKGDLSSKICGYFGLVGRLHINRDRVKTKGGKKRVRMTRVLQVQPSVKWYAKDRLSGGRLGVEVVEPTMAQIVETIRRKKKDG